MKFIFKFSDETEYANYLAAYKTGNQVSINNITGDIEFDDSNLTIVITNDKTNNSVMSEYGEANMKNYSSIRSYFTNTLKYSCKYNNAE